MTKIICLLIVVCAFLYRLLFSFKVMKMEKVKGKIIHKWITDLIFIAYPFIFILPVAEVILINRTINISITIIATIIYLIGIILWVRALKTLGPYWSMDIEISEKQPLIKEGPYRYMRHPHYLVIFLEIFGVPLIANAYYSLFILALIFIPLILLRVLNEEKALIKKFGEDYVNYKKEVWGLFPFPVFKKGVNKE